MPVEMFVDDETLSAIEARTRKAGGEIVGLLGIGSAFVSPALSALDMVDAIVYDKKKIIPSCALLEGEYGVSGLFVGVPVIIGKNGIEKIIEVKLTDSEKAAFNHSVDAVQKTVNEVNAMG
jgi:malate dehydrogenase